MIVVSDTTPIISLLKLDHLHLLKDLFGQVVIPQTVYDELTVNPSFPLEAEEVKRCDFISVGYASLNAAKVLGDETGLDAGESEAIVLAMECKAELLLMDERNGRCVAEQMGIAITGTIGILLRAFNEGMLQASDVRESLNDLKRNNIRFSEALLALVKERIQRTPNGSRSA